MSGAAGAAPLRWQVAWQAIGWVILALVVGVSLAPLLDGRQVVANLDKLQHAAAFALLMAWFSTLAAAARRPAIAVGLLLLGIGIELAQGASSWRRAEPLDVLADAVGIGLGWWLALRHAPRAFAAVERLLGARP